MNNYFQRSLSVVFSFLVLSCIWCAAPCAAIQVLPRHSRQEMYEFYKKRLYPSGKEGTSVIAGADGRILCCDYWFDDFGKSILVTSIDGKDDLVLYAPVAKSLVSENQIITVGQQIGTYGHAPYKRDKDESILTGKVAGELPQIGAVGTAVLASKPGTVLHAGWYGGYGKVVILKHKEGTSLYAHLNECLVSPGEKVRKDQKIGIFGTTGFAHGRTVSYFVKIKIKDESVLNGTVLTPSVQTPIR